MGLLGKLFGGPATRTASDDVLLLHAMMLMAAADGYVAPAELATIEAFVNTLPEFRGTDFDAQMAAVKALRARYDTARDAVAALADISSDAVREKAFVLAADLAMSSGHVGGVEDELLAVMQRILGVDDALAAKVVDVLALKYAK